MDSAVLPKPSANGSQSLHRAFILLRVVAVAGATGMRLTDIAAKAQMHVATTHRLLGALIRERAVNFDPYSRLYYLGYGFLQISDETREHQTKSHFRTVLERVGALTQDTVHLSTIVGDDALCVDKVEGSFPIRTNTLDVGARRPLGVGAGSLALLAGLPEARAEAAVLANEERYSQYNGLTPQEIRKLVRTTRGDGYSFNAARIIAGVSAVGVAVMGPNGDVIGAISVAAISDRMTPSRRRKVAQWIRTEAAKAGLPRSS